MYPKPFRTFAISWNGKDITKVPLQHRLNVDIWYGQTIPGNVAEFEEWEAATAANLDMWKWESGEYPPHFRSKVIAWYRLHSSLESHKRDASVPKKKPGRKKK